MKMTLYLCDLPPPNPYPQSNHEENLKFQYSTPGQYSVLSRSSKPGEIGGTVTAERSLSNMMTKCNLLSWTGSWNGKGQ